MNEIQILESIQSLLQADSSFQADSVTIHNWTILDGPTANAPFVILEMADEIEFELKASLGLFEERFTLILNLWVGFKEWETALEDLSTVRDTVIELLKTNFVLEDGVQINRFFNLSEVVFDYGPQDESRDAFPYYVAQRYAIEIIKF